MQGLHHAKILLDSISKQGHRLTTFECVFPRIVLAEHNTHRQFARNSASSRAIPVEKMIRMVLESPYVPTTWGRNQKGMQAAEEILGAEAVLCEKAWLSARDAAVSHARRLLEIGVHKQTTNRLLEPFMWHTVINTATEYSNFYGLRDHADAHPDIQLVARLMREAHRASVPRLLHEDQWHTPYAEENEEFGDRMRQITSGRCARVSFLTHDGRKDPAADVTLHDRLLASGHMSPLEHAARPMTDDEYERLFRQPKLAWDTDEKRFVQETSPEGDLLWRHFCGPFEGWIQYRKQIPHEDDYGTYLAGLTA